MPLACRFVEVSAALLSTPNTCWRRENPCGFCGLLLIGKTVQNQLSVAAPQPTCRGHARVKSPTMRPASFHSSNGEKQGAAPPGEQKVARLLRRSRKKAPLRFAAIGGTASTRLADNRGVDCRVPSADRGGSAAAAAAKSPPCFTSCVLKGHRRRDSHSVFNRRKVPQASFARTNSF